MIKSINDTVGVHESILDKVKHDMATAGMTANTKRANNWLITKIRALGNVSRGKLMADGSRLRANTFVGGMFLFYYDPKTKDKLPYYDRFPLVIPLDISSEGFLGLNLHYLAPRARLVLLDGLGRHVNNSRYDDSTKFSLTYQTLKSAASLGAYKPCIKRYLATHVRSSFLRIAADEWDIAAALPVEQFVKASPTQVWADSRSKI